MVFRGGVRRGQVYPSSIAGAVPADDWPEKERGRVIVAGVDDSPSGKRLVFATSRHGEEKEGHHRDDHWRTDPLLAEPGQNDLV
jgi:hypothetical protein